MDKNLKKISDLVNNQENREDEKKFKIASAALVCSIVGIDNNGSKKYGSLFQENFNLEEDEFNTIKNNLEVDALSVEENVNYIKTELGNNMFQVMQFLKTLNKFTILDGCNQQTYRKFEKIRDQFLKEHY